MSENTYENRIQQEINRYKEVENIHDLPSIHHYWAHKYLSPIIKTFGFNTINEIHFHYMKDACIRNSSGICRFVSIGSGNCEVEVALAKMLVDNNLSNFKFECLDINQNMLDRGANLASQNGVLSLMSFSCKDLNYWAVDYNYDVIIALQCLHHFVELEMIFGKIHKYLASDGFFLTHDMIGRNGHMRWPETRAIIDELWKELPQNYKYNQQLKRLEDPFMDWDCSVQGFEGIRAQDIMPLLTKMFHFDLFIYWGGIIDVFVDRGFGHNFDKENPADRAFIDKVEFINREKILSGEIKPTQMIAAMGKQQVERKFHLYGLSPTKCTRIPN